MTGKNAAQSKRSTRRYRRVLESEGDDPLSGVANLFDIAMVFVVALLIALVSRMPQQAKRSAEGQVPIQGESLQRYQVGESQTGGRGTRLGMAYQLESGEVIYVPQSAP